MLHALARKYASNIYKIEWILDQDNVIEIILVAEQLLYKLDYIFYWIESVGQNNIYS